MPAVSALMDPLFHPERGAWDSVRPGWKQLYGSFELLGVSVEMHDFATCEQLDWGRSFHRNSVELCLNLGGLGELRAGRRGVTLGENSVGLYTVSDESLDGARRSGDQHRFLTVEFSREFLSRQLEISAAHVEPTLRRALLGRRAQSAVADARPLTTSQQAIVGKLVKPPIAPAALPLWYQSKVLELVAEFCFEPEPEMFCARQKRVARERAERVCEILRARLDAPPSLEELGCEVGVSQFHLSRIFSEEMQMTIPQFVRRIRMERAADLLRDGRHNVTEAAFAVGYSSLGHFSKSFCEVIGCCPTRYPQARHLLRR